MSQRWSALSSLHAEHNIKAQIKNDKIDMGSKQYLMLLHKSILLVQKVRAGGERDVSVSPVVVARSPRRPIFLRPPIVLPHDSPLHTRHSTRSASAPSPTSLRASASPSA